MTTRRFISRRLAVQGGVATAALPLLHIGTGKAEVDRVLRFTLNDDIANLDPHGRSSAASRVHVFAVFDMLFGMDAGHKISPQMVEGVLVEDDKTRWTLTLRDGLTFHDGEPVLARDCVASIRRWMPNNSLGLELQSVIDDLSATSDRRIVFRLNKPFPMLPDALGTPTEGVPAIMPERLANNGEPRVKEIVGSGPFRFRADERIAGSRTVYERFAGYRPREGGTADWMAGPKIANFERVEWTVVPDASTRAAALQHGELDWWGEITPDLAPQLLRDPNIKLLVSDSWGHMLTMMMNHLQPPFSNLAIRRALLLAVNQEEFVSAVAGMDPSVCRTGVGLFPPGSSMASDAGLDVFRHPRDIHRVRQDIIDAGYQGERVVIMSWADDFVAKPCAEVAADMMRKAGLNVDFQSMDIATSMQRMANKGPVDQGGWSCAFPDWVGLSLRDPAANPLVRGLGAKGYPPWASSQRLEELRRAWFGAGDLATQQRIAADIQVEALAEVTSIPLGMFYDRNAFRTDLTGVMQGWPPVFWNVRRLN